MDAPDLDLLAANLRADSSDLGAFVENLAVKLEQIFPGRAKVRRGRRGMFGPKEVRTIALDAGGERLELTRGDGDVIETRCAKISGGIVLKNETVDTEEWLRALGEAIGAEAQRSEQTRRALERLLMD